MHILQVEVFFKDPLKIPVDEIKNTFYSNITVLKDFFWDFLIEVYFLFPRIFFLIFNFSIFEKYRTT